MSNSGDAPLINLWLLTIGALLILSVAAAKASTRVGLPAVMTFLLLGIVAGEEGIGGYAFDNFGLANAAASAALAIILFDGGLETSFRSIKTVWQPAFVLATLGVALTAVVTGVAAAWILDLSLMQGMLLGSIVGSTDASAVFSILRSGGIKLPKRLAATLEVESGSNDPMAIFMTLGFLEIVKGPTPTAWSLAGMFLAQAGIGAIAGLVGGFVATFAVNRIKLDAAGLYPVLVLGFGLLTFGVAATTGGSGFLAAYIAGTVIGNRRLIDRRGILRFHDALGWLSQILMFVMLGLLCTPSRLLDHAIGGLAVAATLMFVARPLAVAPITAFFGYRLSETVYTSWVGLKGAVPITLATFPLLHGVSHARTIFDVVFFAVVVSAIVQGLSLPHVARWLGLDRPLGDPPKELREPASPKTPPVE